MKKLFTLLSFFMLCNSVKVIAGYGYFGNCGTFVEFGSTTYKASACSSGDPALNGASLGTNLLTLQLNTIQQFTYQNGGDNVMNGKLYYRVYENGSPSGSYIAVNLATRTDNGSGNFKHSTNAGINICSGLMASKTYVFDCYFQSDIDWNVTDGVKNTDLYESNGGSNFKATFTTASTLNVDLSNLYVKAVLGQTNISWQTASEKDNALFQIERASNGTDFSPIGEVKGQGNSTAAKNYSFTDVAPLSGVNYYRLKAVDYNGAATLSKVVSVNFSGKNDAKIAVYPNPTRDVLRVDVNAADASTILVQMTDLMGRVVLSQNISINKGANLLPFNVSSLSPGAYFVKVNGDVTRFVKQ